MIGAEEEISLKVGLVIREDEIPGKEVDLLTASGAIVPWSFERIIFDPNDEWGVQAALADVEDGIIEFFVRGGETKHASPQQRREAVRQPFQ